MISITLKFSKSPHVMPLLDINTCTLNMKLISSLLTLSFLEHKYCLHYNNPKSNYTYSSLNSKTIWLFIESSLKYHY